MNKGEISFRIFVIMVVLLFGFLIADLSLSYVNVCQNVGSQIQCKLVPAIELVPTL